MAKIYSHRDLRVYQLSFTAAMDIFEFTKKFPKEEIYSLTDQIRRSSRSVAANISEAWRKRRYEKAFIAKLSDVESEAAETQVWLEFAYACGYITKEKFEQYLDNYEHIISMIIIMIANPKKWSI
ncbi:MAG: four helix bundle protein [Salinivirgaceae bacterium]|nr:four helix bundle protein [Salinivirgaceae bacterium]MDD4729888.1 four helix bundle protein [Dysgonamonadaceae bacterium]